MMMIPVWLIWTTAAVATVLGFWLLRSARRVPRIGATPHCRRCGYNLTGLLNPREVKPNAERGIGNSGRCPECGATYDDRNIVFGERPKRALLLSIGLVLAMAGATGIVTQGVSTARRINWVKHWPTAWLVADLQSSDAA